MKYKFFSGLLFSTLFFTSAFSPAHAGGVALGATRIIYSTSASQASLPIVNSDKSKRYLIQSWVENDKGERSSDFIVTPPLFSAAAKSENTLRIVYAGKPLPKDRETVYWMNVKAIPAIDREAIKGKNTLQLAILSRIKLFMRPDGFKMGEAEAVDHLSFRQGSGKLTIANPTPYYQTLVNLTIGGKKLPNSMVSPYGQLDIALAAGAGGEVRFQIVNDYGAISPQKIAKKQ